MLIVPSEHRIDWRRPPWITLLLIMSCILVFGAYQSGDGERAQEAAGYYVSSGLLEQERDLLHEYIGESAAEFQPTLPDEEPEIGAGMLASIAMQPQFDHAVRTAWQDDPPPEEWRNNRARFEELRDSLSWVRFGVQPADFEPVQLVSHMFMHGGIAHLLGNMIFLFLFGIALERVVGSMTLAGIYLLTGLASVGLFILMNLGSHAPLVGASGAISGLMGAFLGVYGMRRMRFFYTVGFWFGEFTAPALMVFPLWLLKELYGFYFTDSQVAYMAHAGGLIGGLMLGFAVRSRSSGRIDADDREHERKSVRRDRLARTQALITELRLDDARELAEKSVREYPGEIEFWKMYRTVAERLPEGHDYQRIIATLFRNAGNKAMPPDFLKQTLADYRARSPGSLPALRGKPGAILLQRFFREGRSADVDQLLDLLMKSGIAGGELRPTLEQLLKYAEMNRDRRRATRYREYLDRIAARQ